MNKNTYCVYMHKNKINGKIYVGSTKYGDDPSKRWHNGKVYKGKFRDDIYKYGWNNFDHYIIQKNLSLEEASKLEKLTIIKFNTTDSKYGYNINIAGNTHNKQSAQKISESLKGHKVSEETKQKISEKAKQLYVDGYVNPMQDKHLSEEHKQKISNANKGNTYCLGRTLSKETKQKISNSHKGKHLSEETKQKLSNKVWVNDGNKSLLIDKKDLDAYINNGYTRGRNDLKRIWVHKDNNTKRIDINELEYYISIGYSKGRK